jgi:trimeric autotransporter adhesin
MLSCKKKLQIFAAFATLLLSAVGVACSGFFVNPTLTSLAVGPTATLNQGATVQETAVGTYNDGSTNTVNNVQWSSSESTVASISTSGLVTANAPGSATITGASGATTGTATITVNLGNVTALKLSPTSGTVIAGGGSTNIYAMATVQGSSSPVDVSATATWTISDTTDFSITQGEDPAILSTMSSAGAGLPVTVTATYQSSTQLNATGNWVSTAP